MASFRDLLRITAVIFCLIQCKSKPSPAGASVIPQMSRADGDAITKREISVWEYSKIKDFPKLREILADDYIGYFSTGNMQPKDVIGLLQRTTINSYHLSNISVKPVSENTAVIYYDVQQDVTSADGDKWIPNVAASSVYAKRNGVWYAVFYQEMPAQ